MASLTDGTFQRIYELLFNGGRLIGTRQRPNVVTDIETDNIHAGVGYDVSGFGTLTNGANTIFYANVGALPLHFHGFEVKTTAGEVVIELYEAPTVTANGTAITPRNKNRGSANTALSLIYGGTTVSANGTLLFTRKIFGTSQGSHYEGGDVGVGSEWVLKPNTKYIIKITNSSGTTISYTAGFYFYEKAL